MANLAFALVTLGSIAPFAAAKESDGGIMWGRCDKWDRDRSGCSFSSDHKCDSYLSPGPERATLEVVLGNLPVSTPERPVHLQWFAPREAQGYNPVDGPHIITVYSKARYAWPAFKDHDFNGGNVRVNETGHAVLRMKAPSTYVVCGDRVRWPHVHLRLCTGEKFVIDRAETLDFTRWGIRVRACSVKDETKKYVVHSFRRTEHPIPPLPTTTDAPPTTTFQVDATTTTSKFLESPAIGDNQVGDDEFDWDALDFSPVYQCLTDGLVYDHFKSDCAESCPAHADLKHGQCVRKDTMEVDVSFSMAWDLKVKCDEQCWEDKKSRSLHNLRLSAADHLDIPFQEILQVVLRSTTETGRRLDGHTLSDGKLYIGVTTGRMSKHEGEQKMKHFLGDKTQASQLLGMEVHGLEASEDPSPPGQIENREAHDEFAQFYTDSEQKEDGFASIPGSPTDVFPAGVVIGVAGGVVALGMLSALGLWYRKKQLRQQQSNEAVKGEKVGAPEDSKVCPPEDSKVPKDNQL